MPKPHLKEPVLTLESDIIDVLTAGLHQWRPDLEYPQSRSDMQGAVRNLISLFEIKRRLVPYAPPIETEFQP